MYSVHVYTCEFQIYFGQETFNFTLLAEWPKLLFIFLDRALCIYTVYVLI